MNHHSWVEMNTQELQWVLLKEQNLSGLIECRLKPLLKAAFFEDLPHQVLIRGGRVVKDSRIRWAGTLPVGEGRALFIKQYRIAGRWQRIKYLLCPSRARKEWRMSRLLSEKGIMTPKALGMIERRSHGMLQDSFFVAEAIENTTDLIDFCKKRFGGSFGGEEKKHVLTLLAEATRRIHESGLLHRDLHGGNFLIPEDGPRSLYLVDLHDTRMQRGISSTRRLWNIAQIFNSLDFMLDDEAKRLFLFTYGQGRSPFDRNVDGCFKRVEGMVQKIIKRRQKSRAKRCLKESTLFTVERRAGLRMFRRREMEGDEVMAILELHREMVHSYREKLLKYSPKTIVSMVSNARPNGRRVCVKEYRYGTVLDRLRNSFRKPRGKTAWVAGNVLFSRGFSPLKPLAYVERRRLGLLEKAFCLTESIAGEVEMDRYLIRRFQKRCSLDLRGFIRQFAEWIGSLHRTGIYHRDLKTCNILVREATGGWAFGLLDLEDAAQETKIGIEKIVNTLVQINCSVPKFVRYRDRIRFLKSYFKANPVAVDQRTVIRQVLEESRRRGIVYVSPQGVVSEPFD
jgi:tRNA A-37 threonylcarbamoyl transferase component Bud32